MAGENYVNTASTATTSAPVAPAATSFTAASFTGWPAAPFWGEFEKGTGSAEIVRVTSVAGSVLTIVRGQGGTSATSHGAGVSFEHVVPAVHFNDGEVHNAATNAHGVTGVVVGTTGAQTVQDKNFRGAFKSQYSDALPAGITTSFESLADSAAARDGFVHRNTAADAARAGFLLQQSGTDRFRVSNTGNVTVTPSSGTAITANGPASVTGTLGVGAALTVSAGGASVTGGVTVPSGGAAITGTTTVTGNATVSGTLGAGASTVASLASSGAVSGTNATFSGTLSSGSATTLGGNTSVTGTLGATGAVSGASGAFTGAVTAHGGARTVVSIASLASIASPVTDQMGWNTTTNDAYRYDGAVWVPARQVAGRLITTSGVVHSGVSTTEQTIDKLSVDPCRIENGTWYLFNVKIRGVFSNGNDSFTVRVRQTTPGSGAVLADWQWIPKVNGFTDDGLFALPWLCTATNTAAKFYVSVQRVAGVGTINVEGNRRTSFWIDDRGADTAVWSEVA